MASNGQDLVVEEHKQGVMEEHEPLAMMDEHEGGEGAGVETDSHLYRTPEIMEQKYTHQQDKDLYDEGSIQAADLFKDLTYFEDNDDFLQQIGGKCDDAESCDFRDLAAQIDGRSKES